MDGVLQVPRKRTMPSEMAAELHSGMRYNMATHRHESAGDFRVTIEFTSLETGKTVARHLRSDTHVGVIRKLNQYVHLPEFHVTDFTENVTLRKRQGSAYSYDLY